MKKFILKLIRRGKMRLGLWPLGLLAGVLILAGCNSPEEQAEETPPPYSSSAYNIVAVDPADCPDGGVGIEFGIDKDRDGVLESDNGEVIDTANICFGSPGADGLDAQNTLFNVSTEPVGTYCGQGGLKVEYGLDADNSTTLDSTEITNTQYLCTATADVGSIVGRATLYDQPVEVVVFIPNSPAMAISDRDGNFTLHGVPVGTHDVVFRTMGMDIQGLKTGVTVTRGSTTTADVALTAGLQLYGDMLAADFEIPEVWMDSPIHNEMMRREIVDDGTGNNVLQLSMKSHRDGPSEAGTAALQGSPTNGIRAKVKVLDLEMITEDIYPGAEVGGHFYTHDDGNGNITRYNVLVRVELSQADDSTLGTFAIINSCDNNGNCESPYQEQKIELTASGINLGDSLTLSVDCGVDDVDLTTFAKCNFSDGTVNMSLVDISANMPGGFIGEANASRVVQISYRKDNCCNDGGGDGGNDYKPTASMKASFDDVELHDATPAWTLWDNFATDLAKWDRHKEMHGIFPDPNDASNSILVEQEAVSHEACLDNCDDYYTGILFQDMLPWARHIQADIGVQANNNPPAASPAGMGGRLLAVVAASLYNDGTGIAGDQGNVYAAVGLERLAGSGDWNIKYEAWRCPDMRCDTKVDLGSGTLVSQASTDTLYRMVLDWDPATNKVSFNAYLPGTTPAASAVVDLSSVPPYGPALNNFKGVITGLDNPDLSVADNFVFGYMADNVLAY
ncbi:MAG: carboxypeptidase-like regulatory domain-containing protein [Deltaproteobacteria bacterium]|nr:carboxypeptidase-like regulatory domain-containing protein [Deltaproteobacteria bacterium]